MKPYQQVNHQTYLLNNYIGNYLTTSNYITPKLIMDFIIGFTYPKPFSICHD
jgi:hypothetical protein